MGGVLGVPYHNYDNIPPPNPILIEPPIVGFKGAHIPLCKGVPWLALKPRTDLLQ